MKEECVYSEHAMPAKQFGTLGLGKPEFRVARISMAAIHWPAFSQTLMAALQQMVSAVTWQRDMSSKSFRAWVHSALLAQAETAELKVMMLHSTLVFAMKSNSLEASCHKPPREHALTVALQGIVLPSIALERIIPNTSRLPGKCWPLAQADIALQAVKASILISC